MPLTANITDSNPSGIYPDTLVNNQGGGYTIPAFLTPLQQDNCIVVELKNSATASYAKKMGVIRFVSMCSIIWGHSLIGWETDVFKTTDHQLIQSAML